MRLIEQAWILHSVEEKTYYAKFLFKRVLVKGFNEFQNVHDIDKDYV